MPQAAAVASAEARILLIDDDELVAGSLRRYLVLHGTACDVAGDRELAAAYMETRQYGVIVVDPYLTGSLNGEPAALLAEIRELQPDAVLVVLTAYGSPELRLLANVHRISTILPKPQPVVALTQLVLRSHLRGA